MGARWWLLGDGSQVTCAGRYVHTGNLLLLSEKCTYCLHDLWVCLCLWKMCVSLVVSVCVCVCVCAFVYICVCVCLCVACVVLTTCQYPGWTRPRRWLPGSYQKHHSWFDLTCILMTNTLCFRCPTVNPNWSIELSDTTQHEINLRKITLYLSHHAISHLCVSTESFFFSNQNNYTGNWNQDLHYYLSCRQMCSCLRQAETLLTVALCHSQPPSMEFTLWKQ